MNNYEPEVFVSYAWGGESESIVNELEQAFAKRNIKIIRDKQDLGYKGSINAFMERIGQGNCIIVVISNKYLCSPNCMFELVEIADGEQFHDRVFPIVLSDANIYNPVKRLDYVKHWEGKISELDQAMRGVSQANLQGIREEIDQYNRFRDKVSGLISILKDMNTLTPEMHRNNGFSTLIDAVENVMSEIKPPIEQKNQDNIEPLTEHNDNGITNQTYEIELEFSNQEIVRNSLGPSISNELPSRSIYALIVAPIQQGKTRVMKKLEDEYRDNGWRTEYLDIQEIGNDNPITQLLKKKEISVAPSLTISECGVSFFSKCRLSSDKEKPLAIFIDTTNISLSHWKDLVEFLEGAWRRAKDAFGGESLAKKYRVFISSRDAELTKAKPDFIKNVINLPPLSYQDVSRAIEKVLSERDVNEQQVKDYYSYDIFYLSGGHPGMIAKIVMDYGINSNSTNLEDFLRKYRKDKWKTDIRDYSEKAFVESIVNTHNNLESLRVFSQQICTFRYFNKTIANSILDNINKDKPVISYLTDLSYYINNNGLYNGLYTDGIIRDLMALDMLVNNSNLFLEQCSDAKKMCLVQIETLKHVQFINEYLYQSFQYLLAKNGGDINIWDSNVREEIKSAFKKDLIEFIENLKKMFPTQDRDDIYRQMRNEFRAALELHHIIMSDGKIVMNDEKLRSFRFIVNYIYKQENQGFEAGWDIFEHEISSLIQNNMQVVGE